MTKKVFPLELTKSTEELKIKTVPITAMESAGLRSSKVARLT